MHSSKNSDAKPNQRNIVVLEDMIDHAGDAPPFHHPLNPWRDVSRTQ